MATNQEIAALAVSLSLDSNNFNKSMSAINKAVKNLDRDFKSAGQGVENFENTFEGLNRKMEVTRQKIDLMNQKLEAQKRQYQSLEGTLDRQKTKLAEIESTLGKGSAEWQRQADLVARNAQKLSALGTDIHATEGDIRGLNRILSNSAQQFSELGQEAETASEKIGRVADKMKSVGSGVKNAGANMATSFGAATLAIGAGLGMTVKAAADNESQLAKMETAMQGNTKEAKKMVDWAKQYGKETPFEASDVVDATIKLKAYNMNIDEIKKNMTPIGNMAAGMGKGLDQAIEAVADAQTGELERLKEFGITKQMLIDKAAKMGKGEIVNAKGQITNQKALNEALFSIMDERFKGGMERQSKTLKGQLSSLQDSSTQLMAGIGEALMPVVKQLAGFLQTLADKFNGMSPQMKKFIAIGGLIALALTAIMTVLGVLLVGIGSAITAFGVIAGALAAAGGAAGIFAGAMAIITGPVGIVIAIIAGLIAVGVLLYKNWDTVKEYAGKFGDYLAEKWEQIKQWTVKAFNNIVDFFKQWGPTMLIVIAGPIAWISALIYKNWDTIKATTAKVWNGIKDFFVGLWNGIKSIVSNSVSWLGSTIASGWNAIKNTATNLWNGIKTAISNVWNGIKSVVSGAVEGVKNALAKGWSNLTYNLTHPFELAKKAIDKILGGIGKAIGGVKSVASKIGSLFSVETPEFVEPVVTAPSMANIASATAMGAGILNDVMGVADFSSDLYSSRGGAGVMATAASTKAESMLMVKGLQAQNENLETQNNLLMQMVNLLSAGQQIAVNVDGREVARATSSYMDNALRKNRDSKSRARGGK